MSEGNNDRQSAAHLLERELLRYFQMTKSPTEEWLREVIARHGLKPNNNILISNYDFFHLACMNENVTEGIIRLLLKYFPDAAKDIDDRGWSPLHSACCINKGMTSNIIRLLIDAAPSSVRSATFDNGDMPLHMLCGNREVDDGTAIQMLKLILERYPEAVRHVRDHGDLPIHVAARANSPEFCRVLIEAYPGSEQITGLYGMLPLHRACKHNSAPTVRYLYQKYPDAIDISCAMNWERYPIHNAIAGINKRDDPAAAVEIVHFLLDCDPNQKLKQIEGRSLIHFACEVEYSQSNIEAGLQMIKVLFDAHPASVRTVNNYGNMPLHRLCNNGKVDEAAALKILKFLLEKHPEAVRHANNEGDLPIHLASQWRSSEFCRVLIEAYPGSERITGVMNILPLQYACTKGSFATVEYLYRLFGGAINHVDINGLYPIHVAIAGTRYRANPAAAVEVVKFLLDCDPDQKLKLWRGKSLIHWACDLDYYDSNIEAGIQIIKILFDARPEVIGWNNFVTASQQSHPQVQAFVNGELVYARKAQNLRLMMTSDEHGQLPLHRALQNDVRLGSIKLLVRGNPSAVRNVDDNGAFPLHVACEYHDSTNVVEYLLGLAHVARDATDRDGNTALHCACRGAKYDTIALLLEKYGAASISKRNAQGKLPIDLLWESNEVDDRESVEYMESIFQLLKAFPEIVMNFDARAIQSQSGTGKKRKYGDG